mmetsp:Transcript_17441/g.25762  ORF Transcript_17441/g.25762 Transcript_17441/m.25762 type:complete len:498 (-) Transcript_17441:1812-3305(-)
MEKIKQSLPLPLSFSSSSLPDDNYTYQQVGEDDDSMDGVLESNVLQDDNESWKDDEDDDDELLVSFPTRGRNSNDNNVSNENEQDNDRNIIPDDLNLDEKVIQPGDHIFVWRSYGVPRAYQTHAIVLSVNKDNPNDEDAIQVVSFYHRTANGDIQDSNVDEGASSLLQEGETVCSAAAVRAEPLSSFRDNNKKGSKKVLGEVRHVHYGAAWGQRLLRRAGTCTACTPDERALVIARARFLLEHPGSLPPYHALKSNGECAAVWCRLGRWCTLQSSSMLGVLALSQVGGAAVGGIIAANTTVYIPLSGILGSYGWVWVMPATAAYPLLMPTFIAIGLTSLVPLALLWRFRKQWGKISLTLSHEFWLRADDSFRENCFGTSNDSNEEFTKNFFGIRVSSNKDGQGSDEDCGKYMPLGSVGMDDDDISKNEEELMKQHLEVVAEAYQSDGSNTGKARQQTNNNWQSRLGNLGKRLSFRRPSSVDDIPEEHLEHFYAKSVT